MIYIRAWQCKFNCTGENAHNIGKIIKLVLMMTDLNIVSNDQLTHQMIHICTEIFTEKKTQEPKWWVNTWGHWSQYTCIC